MVEAVGKIEIFIHDARYQIHTRHGTILKLRDVQIGNFTWDMQYEFGEVTVSCTPLNPLPRWSCVPEVSFRVLDKSLKSTHSLEDFMYFDHKNISNKFKIGPLDRDDFILFMCVVILKKNDQPRATRTIKIDVNKKSEQLDEICFVVNGKRLYAHKESIKLHSAVLATRLKPEHDGENGKEIEINDASHDNFRMLLRLILPTNQKITKSNFMEMARLADFYDIPSVLFKVEEFLRLAGNKIDFMDKLIMIKRFDFRELDVQCMLQLNELNKKDVLRVTEDPMFRQLSEKTQLRIYRRLSTIEVHENAVMQHRLNGLDENAGFGEQRRSPTPDWMGHRFRFYSS